MAKYKKICWTDADVKCPFYIRDDRQQRSISCEGFAESTDTVSKFHTLAQKERHMGLIEKTGYQPSEEELKKVGMSSEQALALMTQYLRENGLLPSSGSASSAGAYSSIHVKENKKYNDNIDSVAAATRPRRS